MAEEHFEKEKFLYAYLAEHADAICHEFPRKSWEEVKLLLRKGLAELRKAKDKKDEVEINRIRKELFKEMLILNPFLELVSGVSSGNARITVKGILEYTQTSVDWPHRIPQNVSKRMKDEDILELIEDALRAMESVNEERCWGKRNG